MPAAESVRSTSAASDLIWPGGFGRRRDQRGLRFAGAAQDRIRSTGADRGEGALDFRRGQLSCAPTSEETVSSDCCAARAPVWMVSLVLTTRLVSERSASSTCDLMPATIPRRGPSGPRWPGVRCSRCGRRRLRRASPAGPRTARRACRYRWQPRRPGFRCPGGFPGTAP